MNDFEREVAEKKRIARGARCQKGRSRGCRLPSDCLTPAQLRRLHSPVVTYRMDVPQRWQALLTWPEDLRREYVVHLRDGFGAVAQMLAQVLAVEEGEAAALMAALGIAPGRPTEEGRERFDRWRGGRT